MMVVAIAGIIAAIAIPGLNDAETEFFAIADPIAVTTGTRFFGTDQNGQIRQDSAQLADMTAGLLLQ